MTVGRRINHYDITTRHTTPTSPLLQTAFLQTAFHTQGHICWYQRPKLINVLTGKGEVAPKSSLKQVVIQVEQSLNRLLNTRIFRGKASYECGRCAIWVPLGMYRALGKDCHLILGEFVLDDTGTILGDELGTELALDNDVDLCGSRMCLPNGSVTSTKSRIIIRTYMRSVEAARPNEAKSH